MDRKTDDLDILELNKPEICIKYADLLAKVLTVDDDGFNDVELVRKALVFHAASLVKRGL